MTTSKVRSLTTSWRSIAAMAAGLMVLGSTTIGVTAAHAIPPVAFPVPAVGVDFPVGTVPCGPLHLDGSAGETERVFLSQDGTPRFALVTGPYSFRLTNTDTEKTLTLKASGPVRFTPDGTSLFGASLILGPNEVWLTHGPVFFANGAFDPTSHQGQYTDLCPLLS